MLILVLTCVNWVLGVNSNFFSNFVWLPFQDQGNWSSDDTDVEERRRLSPLTSSGPNTPVSDMEEQMVQRAMTESLLDSNV